MLKWSFVAWLVGVRRDALTAGKTLPAMYTNVDYEKHAKGASKKLKPRRLVKKRRFPINDEIGRESSRTQIGCGVFATQLPVKRLRDKDVVFRQTASRPD